MRIVPVLFLLPVLAAAAPVAKHNLMPVPASVQFQKGRLRVAPPFDYAVSGHTDARLRGAQLRQHGHHSIQLVIGAAEALVHASFEIVGHDPHDSGQADD